MAASSDEDDDELEAGIDARRAKRETAVTVASELCRSRLGVIVAPDPRLSLNTVEAEPLRPNRAPAAEKIPPLSEPTEPLLVGASAWIEPLLLKRPAAVGLAVEEDESEPADSSPLEMDF